MEKTEEQKDINLLIKEYKKFILTKRNKSLLSRELEEIKGKSEAEIIKDSIEKRRAYILLISKKWWEKRGFDILSTENEIIIREKPAIKSF